ncbi:pyrroline-5-carboxylate reductase [Teredinibacter franksiae]|uniref:pyrroline-5-carboxylate reductase n=1 Tax=Teredinibacter franksiae TaxID=2761453 RepID=UPI001628A750|nr:pyrroline-5-carboxylate reductase [Teredinibacter franksiae]
MNSTPSIAFIGAGNMAGSIIGGLVANGRPTTSIVASDPNIEGLTALADSHGIHTTTDNAEAVKQANIIVLAIKPQIMQLACESIVDHLAAETLVISIAAGITCSSLKQWLNKKQAVVRCMPNTPALVSAGASALFANKRVSDEQRKQAEEILAAVGTVNWVDNEKDIDAVTAVSGSGPAYFFLMIEAMIDAGIKQGLTRETATTLASQTAYGAAKLALCSDVDVGELRRRVTSPNGTTAEAIASFEQSDFRGIVGKAMKACANRSRALAEELG